MSNQRVGTCLGQEPWGRISKRLAPLGLACCLVLALPAASSASTPTAFERPHHEYSKEIVRTSADDMDVQWRAFTPRAGGLFRLYVSVDLGDYFLIDEQQAPAGTAAYRHRDRAHFEDNYSYQLRFVSRGGNERVIGTLLVRTVGFHPVPSTQQDRAGAERVLAGASSLQSSASSWTFPAPELLLYGFGQPEPEERPPRVRQQFALVNFATKT